MNRYETVDADTLSYDARGNTLHDGINSYAYDVLNRQTVVTNTAAITTEYIYDARGRRVAKVSAGITITHYLYDIQYRVLEERDGSGQLLALYTYGAGIDEPLTMERGGQTYYYHRDALGSVTELSDATGAIVERYEYDVYGAVAIYDANWITRTASAAGNPYLFTGRRFDPESGNYYYRARVYSPALGRFLSMDPLGFEAGDYNLYRYVFGNPTTMVDPTGLQVPLLPTPVPETWLVLHYYKPGEVSVRTEFYPAPVVELPIVGVDVGYRHVKIYEPRLFPLELRLVEEYDEVCTEVDLMELVSLELTWMGEDPVLSDVSLGVGADFVVLDVEIEAGVGGLQGMAYVESPGPLVMKEGVGMELSPDLHRYLIATREEVDCEGDYQVYGERRLPDGFVFVGVELEANNEFQLRQWWRTLRCNSYEACRQTGLERIP